jgi:putative ABC transport system permease protein
MRDLISDLRLGFRILLRNPGFAATAILLLALGIGANTAIFSIVNAVLLRPLPYDDPSRIMQLWHIPPAKSFPGMSTFSVSSANYLDWQSQNRTFGQMAAYGGVRFNVGTGDHAETLQGAKIEPDFFSILRVQPALGRLFSPEENQPGRNHVLLLSHRLWRDHFASDPGIVGQTIQLDGQPFLVAGVMPPKFNFPSWASFWMPTAWDAEQRAVRGNHNFLVISRLKPGVTVQQANADLSAISERLEQQYPADDKGWGAKAVPLREQIVGDIRPALLVLLGAVGFVLLIACANVANLVLAKTLARKKEIAIRTSLGASRLTILRQLLAETLLVAFAGCALGLFLARFSLSLFEKFLADRLPKFAAVSLDSQVLAFTAVVGLASALLAGLLPAVRSTRVEISEALKQGQSRGSSDGGGAKIRGLLVVSEVALSLVLLIGAGLMLRTLLQLGKVQPGFDPEHVLTATLTVPGGRYTTSAAQNAFFDQILGQVRSLPGVQSVGLIDDLPINGGGSHQPIQVEGQPVVPMADQPEVDVRVISPGYLSAMHIRLLQGRDINDADIAGRPPVVLVTDSLAKRFWPNQNPLGKHLALTFFGPEPREVVGVFCDIKDDGLDQTRPSEAVYWPVSQVVLPPSLSGELQRAFGLSIALRTISDPAAAISSLGSAVHQVDALAAVVEVKPMETLIAESLSPQRFNVLLLGTFAGLALVLAAMGIYSVLAYTVRRRVREIGIRMALGASHSDVLKLVVADGMKPILVGVAIGLAAALALGRGVASLIYGVRPTDPATFAAVALLLVAVGLLATALPAYRATRVEPVRTLREE